jgi:hypothetical protein
LLPEARVPQGDLGIGRGTRAKVAKERDLTKERDPTRTPMQGMEKDQTSL